MDLPSYFEDFLADIRPTDAQNDEAREAQKTLRERLESDEALAPVVVSTFLQGSWRRATATRSTANHKLDVDVVAVTKLSMEEFSPEQAMRQFIPFLEEHYGGKYKLQGRSFGIELSGIKLDLVITAAPSESEIGILRTESVTSPNTPEGAPDWRLVESWVSPDRRSDALAQARLKLAAREEEWRLSPLYIPDREAQVWQPTHPLEVMRWTWDKNRRCGGHYVNVVKCLKWWRSEDDPHGNAPKGYPLEHIIGLCCPDGIESVARGVTFTLEEAVNWLASDVQQGVVPFLAAHGVATQDVLARVSTREFIGFYRRVEQAAQDARRALDTNDLDKSVKAWKQLFGGKFPDPPAGGGERIGGYTPRKKETIIGGGRFA